MVSYEKFIEMMQEKVQAFFGEDYTVSVKKFQKNNNVFLYGLTALKKDSIVSPTIYLEPYYQIYLKGATMQEIVLNIHEFYEKYKFTGQMDLEFLTDYKKVKTRLYNKIIHYENNKELLEDVPHKRFLDLAVVCYIHYMNDIMGEGSILVHNGQIEEWNISEETMFADAKSNTESKCNPEILSMQQILIEMANKQRMNNGHKNVEEEEAFLHSEYADAMYVLTHRGGFYGAVSICNEKLLENFSKQCGGSFFILPSSIHELILIPDKGMHQKEYLKSMVEEVNAACVMDEEKLSDNVYYYDAYAKKVNCCFL